ncbi:MAG TPA: 2Fe-2S iron-sulfur cluster-binding protein [Candidatus Thermoplasmatota archaeon]|nr:2Fe-2S iron-sulfur cluster-binding protein [Candidatus Thermoplasmatota archaeon]
MAGTFTFDGDEIPFQEGDTFASALHRAGVKVIARSLKYHRPRGLYCCTGSCASCYVGVDGEPNVPACMRLAKHGASVSSQNTLGGARMDLYGVVDHVYRSKFDPHDAFTRSNLLNKAFLKAVRHMSGLGRVPPENVELRAPRRHALEVDELIVGAGRLGLKRAQAASRPKGRVLVVDELPRLGGSATYDTRETDTRQLAEDALTWAGVECWTQTVAFGVYEEDGQRVVALTRRDGDVTDLVEVRARRVTIAPGRHDAWPLFANNDLPGVLSLRGALRLFGEHGLLPGRRIVVHGDALPRDVERALQQAGAVVLATGEVEEARGGQAVEAAKVGGAWHMCDTIVVNIPGTPRIELFQQAGCELGFGADGTMGPRLVGRDGATTVDGIHGLFSDTRPTVRALAGWRA